MSKTLTKETTFRERSASYSTHGSKRGVNLLGWDGLVEERLSCQQEREALIKRVQQIQDTFTNRRGKLSKAEGEALGREQIELQTRIRAIRPKMISLTRGTNIQEFMMNVLKERISPLVWKDAYEEAIKRCNDFNAARNAANE